MNHVSRTLPLVALAFVTLATECRVQTGPSRGVDGDVRVVVGDPFDLAAWVEDEYSIREARIVGDRLELVVRFSGGCYDHDFLMVRSGAFMESNPVQLAILLAHDGHDDPCDALLTPTLTIGLTSIRDDWREAYHATSGTVILNLHGWAGELRYEF